MLEQALSYVGLGWPVVPLHSPTGEGCSCDKRPCPSPGKHPRTRHGLLDATLDNRKIREWWSKWPDANIAIRTGRESGLVVLDVDPRSGGEESFRQILDLIGTPETPTARTGGSGRHYYFANAGQPIASRSGVLPGIDAKADGGYIVASPSRHISGAVYSWAQGFSPAECQLQEIPAALVAFLRDRPTERDVSDEKVRIPAGMRHDEVMRTVAGFARSSRTFHHLWKRGLAFCEKCIEPDQEKPFTFGELFEICRAAWNYSNPIQLGRTAARKILEARQRKGLLRLGHLNEPLHPTTNIQVFKSSVDIHIGSHAVQPGRRGFDA